MTTIVYGNFENVPAEYIEEMKQYFKCDEIALAWDGEEVEGNVLIIAETVGENIPEYDVFPLNEVVSDLSRSKII